MYIHPDEQVEMLKLGLGEKDVGREREWVLPAHLKEKWTLRGFAGVFDAIGKIPPEDGEGEEGNKEGESGGEEGKEGVGSRRGGKRVLLAIVGEDSTIVYYIVHDGIVKPRQN